MRVLKQVHRRAEATLLCLFWLHSCRFASGALGRFLSRDLSEGIILQVRLASEEPLVRQLTDAIQRRSREAGEVAPLVEGLLDRLEALGLILKPAYSQTQD